MFNWEKRGGALVIMFWVEDVLCTLWESYIHCCADDCSVMLSYKFLSVTLDGF